MIEEKFDFSAPIKKKILQMGIAGVVLLIIGIILANFGGHGHAHEAHEAAHEGGHHAFHWIQRLWVDLWINNVFFMGIAIIGVFFFAIQYVAQAGWSAGILRIPLALGNWLPIAAILMLLVFGLANFTSEWHLFHWMDKSLYDIDGPNYDAIIAGKAAYLNTPFFMVRMITYFVIWVGFFFLLKKKALAEDIQGGNSFWYKKVRLSAIFIILFAITSSTSAWDWILSIDTHWFSTIFGWYIFASWFVTGLATITLIVIFLKKNGYLSIVNSNHLHDLGKFVFAFSIFWTYTWFSQFMLIYYSNIPEEGIYFVERMRSDPYMLVFFGNLIINFFLPFLLLMTRDAKRHTQFLQIVCVLVIFGHWIDFYLMITPGTLKENGTLGLIELGTALVYASAFLVVVFNGLSKIPLIAKNHPMLEESKHHHI